MAKKIWLITLLISIVLLIGLTGCGEKSKKTNTKNSSAKLTATSSNTSTTQVASATTVAVQESVTAVEEESEVRISELSSKEFGRENPFQPLGLFADKSSLARTNVIQANEARLAPKAVPSNAVPPQKPKALPNVKLSLVIDGNTAIFEDNYNSKVVSIGDSVAGMRITEIRDGEAILDGGDKKYKVALGGGVEEVSSPAPKSEPAIKKPKSK